MNIQSNFRQKLFGTEADYTQIVLRVLLGIVIFPHGAQKLLGWFGGFGFAGTMSYFTETMGIPWIFAFLAIVAEFFGSLGLITGFLARISALGIGIVMIVATLTSHIQHGFFMNWYGTQSGEGFEFHILALAIAMVVFVKGAGAWSLDRLVEQKRQTAAEVEIGSLSH